MSSGQSAAAVPGATEVKNLFGMMLDAAEGGEASEVEAAKAALNAAPPAVRTAVNKLLEAHRRASDRVRDGRVSIPKPIEGGVE